ncbi:hypothetical protein [Amycolatopsis sp. CA-230715]|uniref:hypothetical protein n=1 Tax=Amycolatopsis sp. CA-230715 TaxID=2745196 RepID=UPI001C01DCF3|nr:hypothetical protein [Amycolatopsis sp. CA-230715]QWF86075.1 hypothetical protein HUW46_09556 [Amycolatopsis sp. CA-230715]
MGDVLSVALLAVVFVPLLMLATPRLFLALLLVVAAPFWLLSRLGEATIGRWLA